MIDIINELVGNKQFEEARIKIEENLEKYSNNKDFLKLAGLTYINLELWKDAKKIFETIVKLAQDDATSWFYLGNAYEKLGDFISAKNSYVNVIELRPEYFQAYKNICLVSLKCDDTSNAIKYAEKAKLLDTEDYLYDFIIGTSYMKDRNFNSALPYLEEALKKSPKNIGTLNSLGTCYMALNQPDEAIKKYKEVVEFYPKNPTAYFNLGSAYQILQDHELAIEYLSKAIEIDDEDENFLNAIAMSEIKLKDYENALKHYKQLALLCPERENYKLNIAICYEALEQEDEAIKILTGLLFINPKFITAAQKLANIYIKNMEYTKAKEIFDKYIIKNKVSADIFHQYAILSSSLCDTDTAEKTLKKVIQMNPNIAKAHKDLGIIYLNKRLFDYAEIEFKCALELAPEDFETIFEYGNFLYSISKNREAEEYYLKALSIQPKNILALTFMGLNSLVLNKLELAKKYIMQAITIEPNHEYVQFCTGRILYACAEYEEAKRYLIKSVEQNPDIETQNTLALTYFELEDYNQALNIFKNIVQKQPQSVTVLMNIAKCYEKLNENDLALKYLDKLLSIFPDNEEAHEMIRSLS